MSFQRRVMEWAVKCFGDDHARSVIVRRQRFIEEALELHQATAGTKAEALEIVDYVYARPVGNVLQEVGGTMVTIAALCEALNIGMEKEAGKEIRRCEAKILEINKRHFAKPKFGNRPAPTQCMTEMLEAGRVVCEADDGVCFEVIWHENNENPETRRHARGTGPSIEAAIINCHHVMLHILQTDTRTKPAGGSYMV